MNTTTLTPKIKMYTFAKDGVPMTREQLEKAKIETVFATSHEDCYHQREDLRTWHLVEVRNTI